MSDEKTFDVVAGGIEEFRYFAAQFAGVGGVRSTLPSSQSSAGGAQSSAVRSTEPPSSTVFLGSLTEPVNMWRRARKRKKELTEEEIAEAEAEAEAQAAAAAAKPAVRRRQRGPKWRVVHASKREGRAKFLPWTLKDSTDPPLQFEGVAESSQSLRYVVLVQEEQSGEAAGAPSAAGGAAAFSMYPVESLLKFRKRVPPSQPISLEEAEEEMRRSSKVPERYTMLSKREASSDATQLKAAERAAAAVVAGEITEWTTGDFKEGAGPDEGDEDAAAAEVKRRQGLKQEVDFEEYESALAKADQQTAEFFDYQEQFSDDEGEEDAVGATGDTEGDQASVIRSELRAAGFGSEPDGGGDGDGDDAARLSSAGMSMRRLLGQFDRDEVGLDVELTKDEERARQGDQAAQVRLAKRLRDKNRPLPSLPNAISRVAILDVLRTRGLVTMTELIDHFKPLLKGDAIALFSAVVKEVASAVVHENTKYIKLNKM